MAASENSNKSPVDPSRVKADPSESLGLAMTGAAEQFRAFLHYSPEGPDAARVRQQLAEVEKSLSPEAKK